MSRIRQEDLAKAANVSVSTVSLALRNHPSISPATKMRIMDLQKKLGYELRAKKNDDVPEETLRILFCLLRRSPSNSLYTPFLEGVVEASKKWKARLDLDFVAVDEKVSEYAFAMQNGERPDGIILAGEVTEEFVIKGEASADHVVVIGSHHFMRPVHRIDNDPLIAARMIISRVISDGFRSAALLYLGHNDYNEDYAAALQQAAKEQGLPLPATNVIVIDDFQRASEAAEALARLKINPLAVVTPTLGLAVQCVASMVPGAPRCSFYSILAGAPKPPGVTCLEIGQQRLGLMAVDRICQLVKDQASFRDPFTCLVPPIGWASEEPSPVAKPAGDSYQPAARPQGAKRLVSTTRKR